MFFFGFRGESFLLGILSESTANMNKVAITKDSDKKYAPIIFKLGFKHQLCIFHTEKSLNKQLKDYT